MKPMTQEETERRQSALLGAYRQEGSLLKASGVTGVPTVNHKRWIKNDPLYAKRFEEVKAEREALGLPCGKGDGRPRDNWIKRQEQFLQAYRRVGRIGLAAAEAGMVHVRHYTWMRDDPTYPSRFGEAQRFVEINRIGEEDHRQRLASRSHGPHTSGPRYEKTQAKKAAFLTALSECGVTADAAKVSGVSAAGVSAWAQRDPRFAARLAEIREATVGLARQAMAERKSKAGKAAWADTEKRAEWAAEQRKSWTPERRAAQSKRMRARLADPAMRALISERSRQAWEDPERRAVMAGHRERLEADPDFVARRRERSRSPERRAKASASMKAVWAAKPPEQRAAENARLAKERAKIKGGKSITDLEALVVMELRRVRIACIPHDDLYGVEAVMDIYVPSHDLDIEPNGGYWHDEANFPGVTARDAARDAIVEGHGTKVLRLTDTEIKVADWSRLHAALGVPSS